MELNHTTPLAIRASTVMKQLGIGRSTLKNWVSEGRLQVLPFFKKYRMFSAEQVAKLAAIPDKKDSAKK